MVAFLAPEIHSHVLANGLAMRPLFGDRIAISV